MSSFVWNTWRCACPGHTRCHEEAKVDEGSGEDVGASLVRVVGAWGALVRASPSHSTEFSSDIQPGLTWGSCNKTWQSG